MATAPQYYKSKADMAKDLFHVVSTRSFEFATKRALLEHITAALPEWEGKFDRFPRDATARGIDKTRVAVSDHYSCARVPDGCRFWSAGALAHWVAGNRKEKDYFFEHIVPRNVVRNFVLGPAPLKCSQDLDSEWQVPFIDVAHTQNFLERVGIGAVILVGEDPLLDPKGFPGDLAAPDVDSWARYRIANQTNPSFMVYDLSKGTPAF